eukprot:227345-Amphidinium_carterae.1
MGTAGSNIVPPRIIKLTFVSSSWTSPFTAMGFDSVSVVRQPVAKTPDVVLDMSSDFALNLMVELVASRGTKLLLIDPVLPSSSVALHRALKHMSAIIRQCIGRCAVAMWLQDSSPFWRSTEFKHVLDEHMNVWRGCTCALGQKEHLCMQVALYRVRFPPPSCCQDCPCVTELIPNVRVGRLLAHSVFQTLDKEEQQHMLSS